MSGGGLPKMLLWTLSLAVLVVIVAVAAVAARWLLAEAWWLLTGALSVAWRMVSFVWKACIWRPKWWIALPLFGLMGELPAIVVCPAACHGSLSSCMSMPHAWVGWHATTGV